MNVTANFDSINNTLLTLAYPAGGTYAAAQVSLMAVGIPATAIYFTRRTGATRQPVRPE